MVAVVVVGGRREKEVDALKGEREKEERKKGKERKKTSERSERGSLRQVGGPGLGSTRRDWPCRGGRDVRADCQGSLGCRLGLVSRVGRGLWAYGDSFCS